MSSQQLSRALVLASLVAAAGLAPLQAQAVTTIANYDISNSLLNGEGNWFHTFNGSISGNNYTAGSGTLNDGIIPGSRQNNHLFEIGRAPVITLHLSELSRISSIEFRGGNDVFNSIPGKVTGWTVTIGGNSVALASTAFGIQCLLALCDDRVSLLGSVLDGVATNTVQLSNFTGGDGGYFNIGEIIINAAPVPEPSSYALLLAGLGVVVGLTRRRIVG
jgi:hypothetical protein